MLGLTLQKAQRGGGEAGAFIDLLLEVRGELRKQKLWAPSDLVRDRLKALGVTLEDSKEGSTWHFD